MSYKALYVISEKGVKELNELFEDGWVFIKEAVLPGVSAANWMGGEIKPSAVLVILGKEPNTP